MGEEEPAGVLLGPVWLEGQADRWEGPTTSSPPRPQRLQGSLRMLRAEPGAVDSDAHTEEGVGNVQGKQPSSRGLKILGSTGIPSLTLRLRQGHGGLGAPLYPGWGASCPEEPWPPPRAWGLPAAAMATPASQLPHSQPGFPSPAHMTCLFILFLVRLLPLECHRRQVGSCVWLAAGRPAPSTAPVRSRCPAHTRERVNEWTTTLLAAGAAETQRRPQGTPGPVLLLPVHPGLLGSVLPVWPQRRCAAFGVPGVSCRACGPWVRCGTAGKSAVSATGRVTGSPRGTGEVSAGRDGVR